MQCDTFTMTFMSAGNGKQLRSSTAAGARRWVERKTVGVDKLVTAQTVFDPTRWTRYIQSINKSISQSMTAIGSHRTKQNNGKN